ncbi:hypothetical protein IQ238_14595 [Pleurocapsales cyanobacterium LEGE 06147]|nr:hypothetical protein [Pleurocapsales cyanobacterium LEGE 06147]
MRIILENTKDLEKAIALISWLNRPSVEQVLVKLPWLEKAEQQQFEKALKFLFNDCGCQWGTPAFLIIFTWYFSTKLREGDFSWNDLGMSLLIGVFTALTAKLLGLAWSHWRLKIWFRRMMLLGKVMEGCSEDET